MALWNVSDASVIELVQWSVHRTELGEDHFVGYNMAGREGRVSSAIGSFDKETSTGITRSGRKYILLGDSGGNRDAAYVWDGWKKFNKVIEDSVVTSEYV